MSMMIDNTEDLLRVLKKLGIKVTNVEELKDLLASLNAHYNPDAARMRVARQIGVAVPVVALVAAAMISIFLAMPTATHRLSNHALVALFAVLWGVAGLVSLAGLGGALFFLGTRRSAVPSSDAPADLPTKPAPGVTAITDQLGGRTVPHQA